MGLESYGLTKGCRADLVVLDAGSPVEAVRLRATRLLVVAGGRVIARHQPDETVLSIKGRPATVKRRV